VNAEAGASSRAPQPAGDHLAELTHRLLSRRELWPEPSSPSIQQVIASP
jgi:hypothetical protein